MGSMDNEEKQVQEFFHDLHRLGEEEIQLIRNSETKRRKFIQAKSIILRLIKEINKVEAGDYCKDPERISELAKQSENQVRKAFYHIRRLFSDDKRWERIFRKTRSREIEETKNLLSEFESLDESTKRFLQKTRVLNGLGPEFENRLKSLANAYYKKANDMKIEMRLHESLQLKIDHLEESLKRQKKEFEIVISILADLQEKKDGKYQNATDAKYKKIDASLRNHVESLTNELSDEKHLVVDPILKILHLDDTHQTVRRFFWKWLSMRRWKAGHDDDIDYRPFTEEEIRGLFEFRNLKEKMYLAELIWGIIQDHPGTAEKEAILYLNKVRNLGDEYLEDLEKQARSDTKFDVLNLKEWKKRTRQQLKEQMKYVETDEDKNIMFDQKGRVSTPSLHDHEMNLSRIAIIMLDIDHFKHFNDTWGHQLGDVALHKVANAAHNVFRRHSDSVARYGGEEFIITAPLSKKNDLLKRMKALAEEVQKIEIYDPKDGSLVINMPSLSKSSLTVSMGGVMFPEDISKDIKNANMRDIDSFLDSMIDYMIAKADKNLYKSKDKGRNRYSSQHVTKAA